MVTVPGNLECRVTLSTVSSKLVSAPILNIHLDPTDPGPNKVEGIEEGEEGGCQQPWPWPSEAIQGWGVGKEGISSSQRKLALLQTWGKPGSFSCQSSSLLPAKWLGSANILSKCKREQSPEQSWVQNFKPTLLPQASVKSTKRQTQVCNTHSSVASRQKVLSFIHSKQAQWQRPIAPDAFSTLNKARGSDAISFYVPQLAQPASSLVRNNFLEFQRQNYLK